MDRRTFVKSALGLVVLAACPVLAEVASSEKAARTTAEDVLYTTPCAGEPETASGPLMMAGINLLETPDGNRIAAYYNDTEVFNMDASGAELVMLADGIRTIGDIANDAVAKGLSVTPSDVALFFSSLCEAGYLRNIVRVGITE